MNPKLFALVESRLGDGMVSSGTAYAVAPRLLLTALHVVDPDWSDGGNVDGRIITATLEDGRRLECERLLPSTSGLDAALLRVGTDIPGAAEAAFLENELASADWETRGYAGVAGRELTPLQGRSLRWAPGDAELALDVSVGVSREFDPAKQVWKGVSGAPVFVGGEIVGLVVENDLVTVPARLKAVPISSVLRDKALALVLGRAPVDRGEHRARLAAAVLKWLSSKTTTGDVRRLAELLEAPTATSHEELVDALFEERRSCLDILDAVARWRHEFPSIDWGPLVQQLLPSFVDWDAVVPLVLGRSEVLSLNIKHVAMADVALAMAFGKQCQLSFDESVPGDLRARGLIQVEAERGLDIDLRGFHETIRTAVEQRNGDDLAAALFGRAKDDLRVGTDEYVWASLRRKLRHDAHAIPPYVVIACRHSGHSKLLDAAAEKLKAMCDDALVVIRADFDDLKCLQVEAMFAAREILVDPGGRDP